MHCGCWLFESLSFEVVVDILVMCYLARDGEALKNRILLMLPLILPTELVRWGGPTELVRKDSQTLRVIYLVLVQSQCHKK